MTESNPNSIAHSLEDIAIEIKSIRHLAYRMAVDAEEHDGELPAIALRSIAENIYTKLYEIVDELSARAKVSQETGHA